MVSPFSSSSSTTSLYFCDKPLQNLISKWSSDKYSASSRFSWHQLLPIVLSKKLARGKYAQETVENSANVAKDTSANGLLAIKLSVLRRRRFAFLAPILLRPLLQRGVTNLTLPPSKCAKRGKQCSNSRWASPDKKCCNGYECDEGSRICVPEEPVSLSCNCVRIHKSDILIIEMCIPKPTVRSKWQKMLWWSGLQSIRVEWCRVLFGS